MNVAALIEDLKQFPPHAPVRIFIHEILIVDPVSGEYLQPLARECDSMDAVDVKYDGCVVMIES